MPASLRVASEFHVVEILREAGSKVGRFICPVCRRLLSLSKAMHVKEIAAKSGADPDKLGGERSLHRLCYVANDYEKLGSCDT